MILGKKSNKTLRAYGKKPPLKSDVGYLNQMMKTKAVLGIRGGFLFYVAAFIVIFILCSVDSIWIPRTASATIPPGASPGECHTHYVPFPQSLIFRSLHVSTPMLLIPVAVLFAAARLISFKLHTRRTTVFNIAISIVGFCAVAFWAAPPLHFGVTFGGKSTGEVVDMFFPFHLVKPSWLTMGMVRLLSSRRPPYLHPEGIPLLNAWMVAETTVRLVIVCVLWTLSLLLIYKLMGRKVANNDLQLTK